MKILNLTAIFFSIIQLVAIIYFLLRYRSDNLPFFILLIIAPLASIIALLSSAKS